MDLLPTCVCVGGSSWVAYEGSQFTENMYVLDEGEYPNTDAMGLLLPDSKLRSIQTAGNVSVLGRNQDTCGLV